MFDTAELTEHEIRLFDSMLLWGLRIARGAMYFLAALALGMINTYGLKHGFWLAAVIGVLGVGSSTARLSIVAVSVLLAMAVIPASVVHTLLGF